MVEDSGQALSPRELIARHQAGVWRYLRFLGCDDSTADDLTQETFLRILKHPDFKQYSEAATSVYLRRIAKNLFISLQRRNKKVRLVAESETLDEVWDRWIGSEESGDDFVTALKQCLETLTERAQLALKLRFSESTSRTDIGEQLGITQHGAKNLMQRAKKQLKQCIQTKIN